MAQNPYSSPFLDLLSPEQRKRQEQEEMAKQLQQMQAQAPSPMVGAGTVLSPNAGQVRGELSGIQQQEIADVGRQPIRGMREIMSAQTPTLGTALAKTVAAGLAGHYGRKEQKEEAKLLKKALQGDANEAEIERLNELSKEQREEARIDTQEQRQIEKVAIEERRAKAYEDSVAAQANPQMTPYQQEQIRLKGEYYDYLKAKAEADDAPPGLTENQMAIRMEKLETKLDPIQAVVGSIDQMDRLLAPYATGGSQEGRDVPGIGFIEGQRGTIGDTYRLTIGSPESRQIQAAMQELTSERIRERAGLTQTLTETQAVLRGMAQQDLSEEGAALSAYGRVREAYQKDITRLRNATHPDVLARFEGNYEDNDQVSPLAKTFDKMSFPQAPEYGEDIPTTEAREASTAPTVGEVRDGYRYDGGDPSIETNWTKVEP